MPNTFRRGLTALILASLPGAALAADDWPMFGRDHTNQHFSPLTGIDRGNVKALRPAWIFQTGITGYFQAEPVMVDGTLYVSTTQNHVAALDARSGRVLWTYTHKARTEKIFGPPSNRGVAVSGGKVVARLNSWIQATSSGAWPSAGAAGSRIVASSRASSRMRVRMASLLAWTGIGDARSLGGVLSRQYELRHTPSLLHLAAPVPGCDEFALLGVEAGRNIQQRFAYN